MKRKAAENTYSGGKSEGELFLDRPLFPMTIIRDTAMRPHHACVVRSAILSGWKSIISVPICLRPNSQSFTELIPPTTP